MESLSIDLLALLAGASLKAAAILIVAGLAARLWRPGAATLSLLWGTTFAALLALPLLSLPEWGPALPWDAPALRVERNAPAPLPVSLPPTSQPAAPTGDADAVPNLTQPTVHAPAPPPARPFPWATAALGLYLAGVSFFLGRIAVGVWRVRRLRRDANPLPNERQRLDAWQKRLGVSAPVSLNVSDRIGAPAVVGWRRPAILVPRALLERDGGRCLDAVLAHELAHLRRRDHWWNGVSLLAVALYWFHPLVHLARRYWREESELACDDWAVWHLSRADLGDARSYGDVLLASSVLARPGLAAALRLDMARKTGVIERIERLLQGGAYRPFIARWAGVALLAAVTTAAGALGGVHLRAPAANAQTADSLDAATATDAYVRIDSTDRLSINRVVRVADDGRTVFGFAPTTLAELPDDLRLLQKTLATRRVAIQADSAASHATVAQVMDQARRAGFTDQIIAGAYPPAGQEDAFEAAVSARAFGSAAAASPADPTVFVLADGDVVLKGPAHGQTAYGKVALQDLPQALRRLRESAAGAHITIQPDSAASLYLVPWVMDQARRAGFTDQIVAGAYPPDRRLEDRFRSALRSLAKTDPDSLLTGADIQRAEVELQSAWRTLSDRYIAVFYTLQRRRDRGELSVEEWQRAYAPFKETMLANQREHEAVRARLRAGTLTRGELRDYRIIMAMDWAFTQDDAEPHAVDALGLSDPGPADAPTTLHISRHGELHFAAEADTFYLGSLDTRLTLKRPDKDMLLVIDADPAVPHGIVVRAMDIARRAGVVNLRLAPGP